MILPAPELVANIHIMNYELTDPECMEVDQQMSPFPTLSSLSKHLLSFIIFCYSILVVLLCYCYAVTIQYGRKFQNIKNGVYSRKLQDRSILKLNSLIFFDAS